MKKLLCCILIVFYLTGCSGKKLVCSSTENTEDYSIVETIIFKFNRDGNEIEKGEYNLKLEVVDTYSDYLNKFKNSIILEYTNLYSIGVKRKISSKNNTLQLILRYNSSNFDKIDKEELLKHGLYEFGNYEQVKSELENDGYKCSKN